MKGYGGKEEIIRTLSSYESRAIEKLQLLYNSGKVKRWSSEESIFQYSTPWDNKPHKYYMDFTITMKDGTVVFVEVKPSSECKPPFKPKKSTIKSNENYQNQVKTWVVNQSKWNAVKEFCRIENQKAGKIAYKFVLWDEKILGISR